MSEGERDMPGDLHPIEIAPSDVHTAPVVIFFHGRGLGPKTVSQVVSAFSGARVIAPRGTVALKRGTTWFDNERIGIAKPESVLEAEARFLPWLDSYIGGERLPWLCGFSNGGAFAGHLLIRHPRRFSGAALLSGPLVFPPWPSGVLEGRLVFYGRGDKDKVVPTEIFEASESYLAGRSGSAATLHRYVMAHDIVPEEVRDLGIWFADRVQASKSH